MMVRTYASPEAFKQAVEQHLRMLTNTGAEFARRRQILVFDRFLARMAASFHDSVTLKGGLVLELRLAQARATRDVDMRMMGPPENILTKLQESGRIDLGDFMKFEVVPDAEHPDIRNDGMMYDGFRFRVECRLAGKIYGQPFGVDIAFGDPIFGTPETMVTEDLLAFAGIAPPTVRIYPLESHIAEKLHAYTMPRNRPNSRVKDLPDIALLATIRNIDASELRSAIDQTFAYRATHGVPDAVTEPPAFWAPVYEQMAFENQLEWQTIAAVTRAVQAFLNPMLARTADGTRWNPESWSWQGQTS